MQYIYSRTSTQEQNVIAQSELLMKAYPDSSLVEEQASATNMDRPILNNLLKKLVKGDTLVVYDMSRLNRSTKDFLVLLENFNTIGVNLIIHSLGGQSVDATSATGKMILTIMASVEEMNVQLMKEKQAAGIAVAMEAGKYKGKQQSKKTVAACEKALKLLSDNPLLSKGDAAKAAEIGKATLYRYIAASTNN